MALAYTGLHPFTLSSFKVLFTLSSENFSSFPYGTCLLSVSHRYLALEEIYLPIHAAISNNATLRKRLTMWKVLLIDGDFTLYVALFPKDLDQNSRTENASICHNSLWQVKKDSAWALPASLAVTRGISVDFFSSAYLYA